MEDTVYYIGFLLFCICISTHNIFKNPIVKKIAWYGVIFFIGFMIATLFC